MKVYKVISVIFLFVSACALSTEVPPTATPTIDTATETPASAPTFTHTETFTPTITFTPTATPTQTITATSTFAFPSATVNKQAHCRYGPSVA